MLHPLSKVALMGSGETGPSMVAVHRALLAQIAEPSALVLDTTYGFQENADELSKKAVTYFAESLGVELAVATLRRARSATPLQVARVIRQIEEANYIFAGPGSPSYALANLHEAGVGAALAAGLQRPATLCFASAAAMTLGAYTIPVYEIYKAGADPHWLAGLNVLGVLGLDVAVIPHYDNREGTTHDTRFCYMGERRLLQLEEMLPPGIPIIGIDEHTAVVIEASGDVKVHGKGFLTVRSGGNEHRIGTGERASIADLAGSARPLMENKEGTAAAPDPFAEALARYDGPAAIEILAEAVAAGDSPRAIAMLLELGKALDGRFVERSALLAPFIELAIAERSRARERREYETSDRIRAALAAQQVLLEDTPGGTAWRLVD